MAWLWDGVRRLCGARVIRSRQMSDAEILMALDLPEDAPVLQAVLELIDRAKSQCLDSAGAAVACKRETAYYLGARYGLEQLESYLINTRAEAVRRRVNEQSAHEEQ